MDLALLAVIALIAMALLFDYTNGFHDSANSISTVIATGVLRPRLAVAWAAFFNFTAFLLFGTKVADTIGSVVKPDAVSNAVVFAALFGAIGWNYLTWHLGLPSSSSHALIGGLTGAGLAAAGTAGISSAPLRKALIFMVASPIVGLLLAGVTMTVIRIVTGLAKVRQAESDRVFRGLQLFSSAAISLGHGSNDAQKTMGVITALLLSGGYLAGPSGSFDVPFWVVLACYTAISLGTLSGGWKIVRTLGTRITNLRPPSGFSADTSAAVALFVSTAIGAPVSTTHTVAGAVTGVGVGQRTPVQWSVFGRMVIAWVCTVPMAGGLAAGIYAVTRIPNPIVSTLILTVIGLVSIVLVLAALKRAPRPADVQPDDVPGLRRPVGTAVTV